MPVAAQITPNRDSADYYFQRGASFYEDRRRPVASQNAGRRWAMKNYAKSIAFDSSYYWSYRNLGYCYQNFKEYELALANYNWAVLAGGRSGEADAAFVRYDCLDMCFQLAKWAEAEAHCSALLADPHLCTDTPATSCRSVWLSRAEARVKLKKFAEAKQDYLTYQQQTANELAVARQELAAAQQELARAAAQPKPRRLSRRERAILEDGWEEPPKKPSKKEPTPVELLEQESHAVTAKLTKLEKLMRP